MTGDSSAIVELLSVYGLWLLAPLSIIEGPIVTVIGGWLAGRGIMNLYAVFVCIVLGDVIGDTILYALGRGVRLDRLPVVGRFLRIPRARLVPLVRGFRENGIRILVIGKLTQAAGFLVLVAAGAAKVPFGLFVLVNLIAAIPKAIALMALGWMLGEAHARIAEWFSVGGIVMLALVLAGLGIWYWLRHRRIQAERAELPE